MSTRFLCRVDAEGRLVPVSAPDRLKRLHGKERWVSLHTNPSIGLRSTNACRYQWGVCYRIISEETGNDPESIHYGLIREAVRQGILEPEYIVVNGNLIEDRPTTVVDSDVHGRYLTWLRHYALHDLGITIPEPNE
jgi:hypothetical protein